eukprot:5920561-Amphidinium_carterae.1
MEQTKKTQWTKILWSVAEAAINFGFMTMGWLKKQLDPILGAPLVRARLGTHLAHGTTLRTKATTDSLSGHFISLQSPTA